MIKKKKRILIIIIQKIMATGPLLNRSSASIFICCAGVTGVYQSSSMAD
jgi:hypothetical protein